MMEKYAVIVAGGSGERMGSAMPKQFLQIQQKTILWYSVKAFLSSYPDMHIILVLPEEYIQKGKDSVADLSPLYPIQLITGGKTRFASVKNGLQLVNEPAVIFVHDAVRCMVSTQLIQKCFEQTLEKGSAVPAIAATDSIRMIEGNTHRVADRNLIRIIQTPQTFKSTLLLPAFEMDYRDAFTDEATVVEASGKNIELIEGEYENIKITRPTDLLIAEKIIAERSMLDESK